MYVLYKSDTIVFSQALIHGNCYLNMPTIDGLFFVMLYHIIQ